MGIRDAERDAICYTNSSRQPATRVGSELHHMSRRMVFRPSRFMFVAGQFVGSSGRWRRAIQLAGTVEWEVSIDQPGYASQGKSPGDRAACKRTSAVEEPAVRRAERRDRRRRGQSGLLRREGEGRRSVHRVSADRAFGRWQAVRLRDARSVRGSRLERQSRSSREPPRSDPQEDSGG